MASNQIVVINHSWIWDEFKHRITWPSIWLLDNYVIDRRTYRKRRLYLIEWSDVTHCKYHNMWHWCCTFVHIAWLYVSVSACLHRCVCACVCVFVCHVLLSPLTAIDSLTTHTGPSPRPSLDQSCFSCPGPETLLAELSHPQQSHLWTLITWVTTWGSRACWERSQLAPDIL